MSELAKSVAQFIMDNPTATEAARKICRDYLEGRLTDDKLRQLHRELNNQDDSVSNVSDATINSVKVEGKESDYVR
jgi:hypothetical protein